MAGRLIHHVRELEPNNFYIVTSGTDKLNTKLKYNLAGKLLRPKCMGEVDRPKVKTKLFDSRR